MERPEITKEMLIGDILKICPNAAEILMDFGKDFP